jgi:DNA-binding CsgD family transcriptional regulator
MALSPELISAFLSDLYEAAVTPEHWQAFLTRLRDVSGSSKAYFLLVDPQQRCDLSLQSGCDDSFASEYAAQWSHQDIVLDSFVAAQQRSGGDWVGDRESVLDDRAFLRSPIYNEFIRAQGDRDVCAAALGAMPDGLQGGFAMRRAIGTPDYGSEVVTLLAVLAPHMKRAIGLHRTFTGLRNSNAVLASTVEAFETAVLSLDDAGTVLQQSAAATRLLNARDGLSLTNGRLRASVSSENAALQALIAGAVSTGAGNVDGLTVPLSRAHAPQASREASATPAFGGALRVTRRPPRPPLQVVVSPFRSQIVLAATRPVALIFLSDPQEKPVSRTQALRALYGLAPTEARIVDLLLAGHAVKEIADRLRLTETTARFHLKEIFRKTGTHSQSALLHLALALPGTA